MTDRIIRGLCLFNQIVGVIPQCLLAHRVGNKRIQYLSLNSDWFIGLTGFGKLKALIANHVEDRLD